MPATLAIVIRAGADCQHADHACNTGYGRQQTDVKGVCYTGITDERGHPEADGIGAQQNRKVNTAQHPYFDIEKTVLERMLAVFTFGKIGRASCRERVLISVVGS